MVTTEAAFIVLHAVGEVGADDRTGGCGQVDDPARWSSTPGRVHVVVDQAVTVGPQAAVAAGDGVDGASGLAYRMSCADLVEPCRPWLGARRAGLPRLSGGAGAEPAAPRSGAALSALDWKAGTLGVTHSVRRIKDRDTSSGRRTRLLVGELKTPKSRRTLALTAEMVVMFRQHRVRQAEAQMMAGTRWQDHGLIFASEIGTPMDPENF